MMSAPGSRVDTPKFVRAEGPAAPLGPAAMPVLTADSRRIGTLPPKELDGALKAEGGTASRLAPPCAASERATGPLADGSLVPIDTSGVDARYGQANERYREDGQDDVAHSSLLKEEPSQPPSI